MCCVEMQLYSASLLSRDRCSSWFSIQGVRKIKPRVRHSGDSDKKLTTEHITHKSINGDTRLVHIWVFLGMSIYKNRADVTAHSY